MVGFLRETEGLGGGSEAPYSSHVRRGHSIAKLERQKKGLDSLCFDFYFTGSRLGYGN